MKPLLLMLVMSLCSAQAMADCQLLQSQQQLSYGRLSAADRQTQGQRVQLPEKQVVLNITCDAPQRIRLFTGSTTAEGGKFGFGDQGEMTVTAADAVVDNKSVRLVAVHAGDATQVATGTEKVTAHLNQGIAFVDGTELRVKTASVTLTIKPEFKSGSLTDRTLYRGNLRVRMEAQ